MTLLGGLPKRGQNRGFSGVLVPVGKPNITAKTGVLGVFDQKSYFWRFWLNLRNGQKGPFSSFMLKTTFFLFLDPRGTF